MSYPPAEPPISPDDTQPTGSLVLEVPGWSEPPGDTRPLTPVRARPRRGYMIVLLMAAGAAGVAVMVASALLLFTLQATPAAPLTVSLRVDGREYVVQTSAATVSDLLREQGVILQPDAVVAPAGDTPITAGMMIAIGIERPVTVTIDGETSVFRTVYDNPLDILESLRFYPDADDQVRVNGVFIAVDKLLLYPLPANEIEVSSTVPVTIRVDGEEWTIETTVATVGDVLQEAGITLYLGDQVTPDVDVPVEPQMQIVIERSLPVTVLVDGVTIETRTPGVRVADALRDAGVTLNGLDYAVPPESVTLTAHMQVRVVRVREAVETMQESVAFETVYQADSTLPLDTRQVIQSGQAGINQRNVRVRYEDEVEVSRLEEGVTALQAPVNQIIAYGTQIVLQTVDTPDGPREYWRKLRVYATSYHPAALGGDDITATGRKLTKGIVGIDPRLIPYDTQVYVPGYGAGIAADTGAPRRTQYWIDLGYDDANWVSWSRMVDVYLLTPVPDKFPLILPPQ